MMQKNIKKEQMKYIDNNINNSINNLLSCIFPSDISRLITTYINYTCDNELFHYLSLFTNKLFIQYKMNRFINIFNKITNKFNGNLDNNLLASYERNFDKIVDNPFFMRTTQIFGDILNKIFTNADEYYITGLDFIKLYNLNKSINIGKDLLLSRYLFEHICIYTTDDSLKYNSRILEIPQSYDDNLKYICGYVHASNLKIFIFILKNKQYLYDLTKQRQFECFNNCISLSGQILYTSDCLLTKCIDEYNINKPIKINLLHDYVIHINTSIFNCYKVLVDFIKFYAYIMLDIFHKMNNINNHELYGFRIYFAHSYAIGIFEYNESQIVINLSVLYYKDGINNIHKFYSSTIGGYRTYANYDIDQTKVINVLSKVIGEKKIKRCFCNLLKSIKESHFEYIKIIGNNILPYENIISDIIEDNEMLNIIQSSESLDINFVDVKRKNLYYSILIRLVHNIFNSLVCNINMYFPYLEVFRYYGYDITNYKILETLPKYINNEFKYVINNKHINDYDNNYENVEIIN